MRDRPPIHPGEILQEEFLGPMGISRARLARDIGVPAKRIDKIVRKEKGISADTALRLARYFGMSLAAISTPPSAASTINSAYAISDVSSSATGTTSRAYAGTLIGAFASNTTNVSSINAPYAIGNVTATGDATANTGFIVAKSAAASVTDSYWNTASTGIAGGQDHQRTAIPHRLHRHLHELQPEPGWTNGQRRSVDL